MVCDIDSESLDLEQKKNLAKTMASPALAAQVVAYKVLGLHKEFAMFCMQELSIRKGSGDIFDYESYIDENIKKMPKPPIVDLKSMTGYFNLQNISSLIRKK